MMLYSVQFNVLMIRYSVQFNVLTKQVQRKNMSYSVTNTLHRLIFMSFQLPSTTWYYQVNSNQMINKIKFQIEKKNTFNRITVSFQQIRWFRI